MVAPGDALYLLDGDHGAFRLDNAVNRDFVSVEAARANAHAQRDHHVRGIALGYSAASPSRTSPIPGTSSEREIDADDILFTQNTIQSQADVSSWTQADWRSSAIAGVNASGHCVAITDNTIRNVGSAIGVSGSSILVRGNAVDHFGDDGIDFGQGTDAGTLSDLEISRNTLTNNLDIGDGNHNDGLQGWVLNGTTGTDVLIDSNTVIAQADPALPFPGNMQGISEFDGAWEGIEITNNVVIAAAYHGIALYGAHDARIVNNTVFGTFIASNGDVNETWIGVFDNKDGTPPVDVVVRNNVASLYSLASSGVTADHNVTATDPVRPVREVRPLDLPVRPPSHAQKRGVGLRDDLARSLPRHHRSGEDSAHHRGGVPVAGRPLEHKEGKEGHLRWRLLHPRRVPRETGSLR